MNTSNEHESQHAHDERKVEIPLKPGYFGVRLSRYERKLSLMWHFFVTPLRLKISALKKVTETWCHDFRFDSQPNTSFAFTMSL